MGRLARRAGPHDRGRRLSAPLRLTIASVGRFKSGPERGLFEHFRRRVSWETTLREVEAAGGRADPARIGREADRLEAAVPAGARRVALDVRGKALSSERFARILGDWRDTGRREIVFFIGGADGLAAGLVAGCDLVLSYGNSTWPHLLVRGMLMEQIYRAQRILADHPYHRDE